MNQNNSGFFGSIPTVTKNLLIINVLCLIAQMVLEQKGIDLVRWGGLHYIQSDNFYPHQFITYMFLHGGFQHMFFNMFAVFMFGRTLETVWGPKRFLTYYLATGVGAAIVQMIVSYLTFVAFPSEELSALYATYPKEAIFNIIPATIGASGAVFGVLLAYGMLFPNAKLFIIPFPFPIKAKYFVIGYGVLELFLGISNNPADNVAHFAHLGGLIFGFFIILYWRSKGDTSDKIF